jgi:hypothetical protein
MPASSRTATSSIATRLSIAATACLITLGACTSAAVASTSAVCPSAPTSTPFAQFGDSADYSLVPGGSFESGAPGWSLTGSTIVTGNESYEVAGGTQSLAIQPGGVALSPAICVTTADVAFRLFVRRTSGSWGVLNVSLRWTDASGMTHNTTVASLQGGTSWAPSPILELAGALPLWQPGSSLPVKLVFSPEQCGGAWAIDDVYVDPRMS